MGQFAQPQDVADRYEDPLTEEQLTRVSVWIVDAEALLTTLVPRLTDITSLTMADMANAKRLVCQAVLSVVRNPGGWQSITTGPFSVSDFARNVNSAGKLVFSPGDLAVFDKTVKRKTGVVGIAGPRWSA